MAWLHHTTEIEKRPAQVLLDDNFRARAPIRELPRLSWVGIYCRQDPGSGFWHPDETEMLDSLEDDLIGLCEQFGKGWAVYVMRIDTRGIREYYFYSGGSSDLAAASASLKTVHPEYRIDFDQKSDPEWERYRTFLPPQQRSSLGSFLGRLFGKK